MADQLPLLLLTPLAKAKGEGTRGGQVVGHTKSGKAKYGPPRSITHPPKRPGWDAGSHPKERCADCGARAEEHRGSDGLCPPTHTWGRPHDFPSGQGRSEPEWDAAIQSHWSGTKTFRPQSRFNKAKPPPKATPAPEKPPPSREDQGKHVLGHTKSKKPVYASGAEGHGFSDDEHQEAARLHAAAHAHHARTAEKLRAGADADDDWQRSEGQHGRADAHDKLAAHHFDLARDHLLAGGHGGEVQMGLHQKSGRPSLTRFVPHPKDRRTEARERLKKRAHAEHPGGAGDSDRAAYTRRP